MSLAEIGNPPIHFQKITEDDGNAPTSVETEAPQQLWGEYVDHETAQLGAKRLRFYPVLRNIVGKMAQQHMEGRRISSDHEKTNLIEQSKQGILDVIYSGTSPAISDEIVTSRVNQSSSNHHIGHDYDRYRSLVNHFGNTINSAWESTNKAPMSAEQRLALVIPTAGKILLNDVSGHSLFPDNSAQNIYQVIGYSKEDIKRIQQVRTRTMSVNFGITFLNDNVTTGTGIAAAHFIEDNIPAFVKYPLVLATAGFYYQQLAKTIDKIRISMEEDPEVSLSLSAYTAFPIIQKLYSTEEPKAKSIAVGAAYIGLNPYEAYKEILWDYLTLTSQNGGTMRLAGDGLAIGLLYAQRVGVLPHLNKAWEAGRATGPKIKNILQQNGDVNLRNYDLIPTDRTTHTLPDDLI